ncbi:uncharacterized protein PHALS_06296 [Plasmopara halstedii]|uniref:Uncharacterized protein n=1 Tax=Plasmopara halstedii TaxID=4781 RepID=A0A0P1B3E8_PLAHL|nr:uncharacterized protein PHALS_06296 [Plasmopara halstedii]CEG48476.1 hypothetical protein PHALS_06296 [Plasmopara halstedii]|eukprot:XP_024584845.1 hypothetical protein PHALS_06296 [Plasmopara halstedii]
MRLVVRHYGGSRGRLLRDREHGVIIKTHICFVRNFAAVERYHHNELLEYFNGEFAGHNFEDQTRELTSICTLGRPNTT